MSLVLGLVLLASQGGCSEAGPADRPPSGDPDGQSDAGSLDAVQQVPWRLPLPPPQVDAPVSGTPIGDPVHVAGYGTPGAEIVAEVYYRPAPPGASREIGAVRGRVRPDGGFEVTVPLAERRLDAGDYIVRAQEFTPEVSSWATDVPLRAFQPPAPPALVPPATHPVVPPRFLLRGSGEPSSTVRVAAQRGDAVLSDATGAVGEDGHFEVEVAGLAPGPGAVVLRATLTNEAGVSGEARLEVQVESLPIPVRVDTAGVAVRPEDVLHVVVTPLGQPDTALVESAYRVEGLAPSEPLRVAVELPAGEWLAHAFLAPAAATGAGPGDPAAAGARAAPQPQSRQIPLGVPEGGEAVLSLEVPDVDGTTFVESAVALEDEAIHCEIRLRFPGATPADRVLVNAPGAQAEARWEQCVTTDGLCAVARLASCGRVPPSRVAWRRERAGHVFEADARPSSSWGAEPPAAWLDLDPEGWVLRWTPVDGASSYVVEQESGADGALRRDLFDATATSAHLTTSAARPRVRARVWAAGSGDGSSGWSTRSGWAEYHGELTDVARVGLDLRHAHYRSGPISVTALDPGGALRAAVSVSGRAGPVEALLPRGFTGTIRWNATSDPPEESPTSPSGYYRGNSHELEAGWEDGEVITAYVGGDIADLVPAPDAVGVSPTPRFEWFSGRPDLPTIVEVRRPGCLDASPENICGEMVALYLVPPGARSLELAAPPEGTWDILEAHSCLAQGGQWNGSCGDIATSSSLTRLPAGGEWWWVAEATDVCTWDLVRAPGFGTGERWWACILPLLMVPGVPDILGNRGFHSFWLDE